MALRIRQHGSILDIDAAAWNALAGDSPFLRHEFLSALERTGCVGGETAWHPAYLTVEEVPGAASESARTVLEAPGASPEAPGASSEAPGPASAVPEAASENAGTVSEVPGTAPQNAGTASAAAGGLIGALPLWIKYDSRGEFVFDWSWAAAYEQAGLAYYPKLVAAVPFTPATGRRLLVAPHAGFERVAAQLLVAARALGAEVRASSLHVLFPAEGERSILREDGLMARKSCQFHWHDDGYASFEDFLARFTSAKRKKVRRERKRIAEAGIAFEHLRGDEPTPADWDAVHAYYAHTFLRRGRAPYLNREFFAEIARTMPENLVVIVARFGGRPIAAAICFRSDDTLYGRYWGSLADFHSLHFEACYYQGIDYCIREGLRRFEPGTQGEHKLSRGFMPTATWSSHWIANPRFAQAIRRFLRQERDHVNAYMRELASHTPYRRDRPEPGPAQGREDRIERKPASGPTRDREDRTGPAPASGRRRRDQSEPASARRRKARPEPAPAHAGAAQAAGARRRTCPEVS